MEQAVRPIAVFDSGVGGISVLRELVKLMPNENYIYYGDSKKAPYGLKSLDEVRFLTEQHVTNLLKQGAKAVVIACNTATSADITILRNKYPQIPMIGIEPALKPAVLENNYPRVLVMATPMTIQEGKFHKLWEKYEGQADVLPLPCPGLVEYIENGRIDCQELEDFLKNLFQEYMDPPVDSVVLGCTHYPFAAKIIRRVLGNKVHLYDGGEGTARETKRRLEQMNLLNPSKLRGEVRIENSDDSEEKLALCQMLLESK